MDLVFTYSIIVGILFVLWLVMVILTYHNNYRDNG